MLYCEISASTPLGKTETVHESSPPNSLFQLLCISMDVNFSFLQLKPGIQNALYNNKLHWIRKTLRHERVKFISKLPFLEETKWPTVKETNVD